MKTGDTISHYRIVALLGAGGMGVVYKAEDTRLRRAVALKFLPLGLLQDRDAKDRLVHEAQAASALDHPNICTIYEIDETSDGQLFLAMACYDGETLKERLARGPLTADESLDLIVQIARGVAAAHEAGIIHRDIKPANIILTRRGELKLLDFGLAKLADQTTLTRTGTTLGTVAYMSPEQIAGAGADQRSDVWALGVLFYELLTGRRPFVADNDVALLRAIANDPPRPPGEVQRDTPTAFEPVAIRALQKEPRDRYASASEFLHDVEALQASRGRFAGTPIIERAATRRWSGQRRIVIASGCVIIAAVGSWLALRSLQTRRARRALPALSELIRQEEQTTAFHRIHELEPQLAGDREFESLKASILYAAAVQTTPPGADVYVRGYTDADASWIHLGQTPLDTRGPAGLFRWRVSKAGYMTYEGAHGFEGGGQPLTLIREGSAPDGMVPVPGGTVVLFDREVAFGDFFIDRYEVSNRAFKRFIDAGGYRNRDYWQDPFVRDGRPVAIEDAMREFRDATGRPGPSTWELGRYPEGHDDFPVTGVSWYEASAYARFTGAQLPTVHHWRKAANSLGIHSEILSQSNFSGKGAAAIGSYPGLSLYGTYDMAGNAKEWCSNAVRGQRYILGGGWNEPSYRFQETAALPPFDRSEANGFRTIKPVDAGSLPEPATRAIEMFGRNYAEEKPVSDEVFRIFKELYSYDPLDLRPVIESTDDSSPFWRVERITYAAAYGNERIIAHLFLPKNAQPPYQTVVYFPTGASVFLRSFEQAELSYLGFIVKSGHALLLPMYKGTYERRLTTPQTVRGSLVMPANGLNGERDLAIAQIKDVRRSVDYLETRPDIARRTIAYFGVSYGAIRAPLALSVDNRFKIAVLWSGGLPPDAARPEIDPLNFAPHVSIPVLMLNGRDDFTFPVQSSQIPMFERLGTAAQDKRRMLFDGGHVFPFARIEKDTLEWLDKYFGPTQ